MGAVAVYVSVTCCGSHSEPVDFIANVVEGPQILSSYLFQTIPNHFSSEYPMIASKLQF